MVSIWWSTRLRRPAAPLVIEDVSTEELREAVAEGRAALAEIDDARAAIIACYVAMERRLADRGTARGAADTPDELLARAVAAGAVRGGAAGRLTALFYEARFSTHPLGAGQRDAASAALDELAARAGRQAGPPQAAAAAGPPAQAGPAAGRAAAAGQRRRAVAGYELAPRAPRAGHRRRHGRRRRAGRRRRGRLAGRRRRRRRDGRHRPAAAARRHPQVGRPDLRRRKQDKQRARAISGYAQRRFIVATSLTSRPMYESDLRPVLEHILAARLAENHAVNLYTEPDGGQEGVLPDPGATRACGAGSTRRRPSTPTSARASKHGIPRRTLARLITRLEQL